MAQHAFLRFEKHKGNPARPLEAHHERQKEQYASNPDIDTSRSKYNFHIVKPEGRYYHFIKSRIEQAGCRTRKDSTRFVDTLITAKTDSVANRRLAFARTRDNEIVAKLFNELGPRFASRAGGYTRILKCGFRAGDNAPMAYIELVDRSEKAEAAAE